MDNMLLHIKYVTIINRDAAIINVQTAAKRLGISLGALSSGRVGIAGFAPSNMSVSLAIAIR